MKKIIKISVIFWIACIFTQCKSYDRLKSSLGSSNEIQVRYIPGNVSIGNNFGKHSVNFVIDSMQKQPLPGEFSAIETTTINVLKAKWPLKQISAGKPGQNSILWEIDTRVFYDGDPAQKKLVLKMYLDVTIKDHTGKQIQWLPKFTYKEFTGKYEGALLGDMLKSIPVKDKLKDLLNSYENDLNALMVNL